MLISELITLFMEADGGVVVSLGLKTHPISLWEWKQFKGNLAGLNVTNLKKVRTTLVCMGLVALAATTAQAASEIPRLRLYQPMIANAKAMYNDLEDKMV